ncbi:Proline dehydrogenase [Terriglobus saanensis SP1PR4]|uniref:proline dehydrogenase n=1 Tax=Terriglobus saanensis (strain ATCC BAA-1853 / DSM 23119 / SP1PR4) TaxID=401053 RepID=E8V8S6_TERSS|nr:Proline dehydrogenase [Terriglobus saanensis SP1PR4]
MNLFRDAFISLSESKSLRHFAENSTLARKVSGRFVAGVSLSEALAACQEENRHGRSVTLDALGENVQSEAHAQATAAIYHLMLDRIAEMGLDANVSLKLTQMGMDLGVDVAESIVKSLSEHACALNNFVRVDMEGSSYTEDTIGIVTRLHGAPAIGDSVGVVVQSYLFRTEEDIDHLIANGIRVRLCKGAYKETENIAFAAKGDVDANYVKLMKRLLTSGIFHGLATHDESIIHQAQAFVKEQGIDPSGFEFQMLYGIRRDLQDSLVKQGYRVRVYVPFGGEWYPYFMRRLAERPANALFIARNLFR